MSKELEFKREVVPVKEIEYNRGQVEGLPKNPRFVKDNRYELMKKSISDSPEMLELREVIIYPFEGKYVAIGGNLRLRALKELGYKEAPCKILPEDTPKEKLREYAYKDNQSFGEDDNDILRNEWDTTELVGWGFELEQKKPSGFKERFNSIKDEDAVYPLVPKYDESHQMFIILVDSEVDANWLRERLGMQKMLSYKTSKVGKSNVIHFKDFKKSLMADDSMKG